MAWNAAKPAGADKIKDSDDNIRLNNDAIETVLGTNITAGPTSIQDAILGDGTKGRQFRAILLIIDNGTDGVSLKCTTVSRWNGDVIAETDNIILDATTGDFSLSADGKTLTVEASGLTGNCIMALGVIFNNACGTALDPQCRASANDILIKGHHTTTGAEQDLTTLVDTGTINMEIRYITDA